MKVYTPNLIVVEYIGENIRRFWEAKGVEKPLLKTGDKLLLPNREAALLVRSKSREFEISKNQEVYAGSFASETQETKTQEIVPFVEDIDLLDDEQINRWCEHFNIKKGNKKIETLKSILIPFLPSKEK